MREYFEPMLGTTGALIAQFAITLVVILILVLIVFWLIRRFTGGRFGTGSGRSRQPRLSLLDAMPIDQRRRLVLVRRDNVEHLLLIGGPSDVVVEASIHRPPPAQRRAEAMQQRGAPAPRPGQPAAMTEAQRAAAAATEYRREPALQRPAPEAEMAPPPEPQMAEPPAPEPVEPMPMPPEMEAGPAEPPPPPQPPVAAPPQRQGRAIPAFLGGGRSRAAQPTEPPAPRREGRVRVADTVRPLQRATASPFARQPAPAEPEADAAPRPQARTAMPPAPPIEADRDDEPFGIPRAVPGPAVRQEPVIERDSPEEEASPSEDNELRALAPVVEPPTEADQPIPIDDAFGEEAPVLRHGQIRPEEEAGDEERPQSRPTPVGDLEKEMARLLGEISGSKR